MSVGARRRAGALFIVVSFCFACCFMLALFDSPLLLTARASHAGALALIPIESRTRTERRRPTTILGLAYLLRFNKNLCFG